MAFLADLMIAIIYNKSSSILRLEKKANFCYISVMISQLTGQIVYRGEKHIILEVNGVGYRLFLSLETLKQLQLTDARSETTVVKFWTYLAVRENALDLYGFLNKQELDFFELLITVSGVGPKSAITILS